MASSGQTKRTVRSGAGGDIVERVAKLNAKLASEEGGGESVLESLRQLQGMRMTFEVLETTKVGRAVNALRKSAPSEQARQLAAELYRRWKALADEHFVATRRARASGAAAKVVDESVTTCSSPPVEAKKEEPAAAAAANGSSAVAEAMPPAVVKKQRNIVRLVIKNSKPPSGGDTKQQSSAASPAMTVSHQGKGPAVAAKRVSPTTTSAASSLDAKAKPPTATAPPKPSVSGAYKRKEAPAGALDEARLARAKKKLHEGYKEASTAREKRKIQVIAAAAPGKRRQR